MMIDDDIIVRVMSLPYNVKGVVSPSPDGVYNIYLNSRHTHETQKDTLKHELMHIAFNDFESNELTSALESKNR